MYRCMRICLPCQWSCACTCTLHPLIHCMYTVLTLITINRLLATYCYSLVYVTDWRIACNSASAPGPARHPLASAANFLVSPWQAPATAGSCHLPRLAHGSGGLKRQKQLISIGSCILRRVSSSVPVEHCRSSTPNAKQWRYTCILVTSHSFMY